jgi:hypothetical protein
MIPLPPPHPNKKIAPVAAAGVEDRSFSLWLRLLGCFASPALPSAGAENMEYYFVNSQTMNRFVKKSNLPVLRIRIQKNCQKALKNMVLGSGIRKKPIPDPGSRIQWSKSTQSRIPGSLVSTLSVHWYPDSTSPLRFRIRNHPSSTPSVHPILFQVRTSLKL